jgi:hypothetical protein
MNPKTRKAVKHLVKNPMLDRRKIREDLRRIVREINTGRRQ